MAEVRNLNKKRSGASLRKTDSVYVGRPSKWGNPFILGRDGTRVQVIERFEKWFLSQPELIEEAKKELRGKDLLCWCAPERCHADIILRVVNADDPTDL